MYHGINISISAHKGHRAAPKPTQDAYEDSEYISSRHTEAHTGATASVQREVAGSAHRHTGRTCTASM